MEIIFLSCQSWKKGEQVIEIMEKSWNFVLVNRWKPCIRNTCITWISSVMWSCFIHEQCLPSTCRASTEHFLPFVEGGLLKSGVVFISVECHLFCFICTIVILAGFFFVMTHVDRQCPPLPHYPPQQRRGSAALFPHWFTTDPHSISMK